LPAFFLLTHTLGGYYIFSSGAKATFLPLTLKGRMTRSKWDEPPAMVGGFPV
jgi:hypothetical protein